MNREYDEDSEYEIKGERRGKKLNKKRNIMRVNSRGLKSIILPVLEKKSKPKSKTDYRSERVTKELSKTISFNY